MVGEYQKTRVDYKRGVEWHRQKSLSYDWAPFIERFIGILKGKKVLDGGCGVGRDIKEFLKGSIEVEGLDFSVKAIRICRSFAPQVPYHVMDILRAGKLRTKYDGIWACASLLNIKKKDVPRVLRGFRKILNPEGVLFVSVKEGEGERMVADEAGKRLFSFFAPLELKRVLEEAGFRPLEETIVPDQQLTGKASANPNWVCVLARKKG